MTPSILTGSTPAAKLSQAADLINQIGCELRDMADPSCTLELTETAADLFGVVADLDHAAANARRTAADDAEKAAQKTGF